MQAKTDAGVEVVPAVRDVAPSAVEAAGSAAHDVASRHGRIAGGLVLLLHVLAMVEALGAFALAGTLGAWTATLLVHSPIFGFFAAIILSLLAGVSGALVAAYWYAPVMLSLGARLARSPKAALSASTSAGLLVVALTWTAAYFVAGAVWNEVAAWWHASLW